jgi:ankyrin repeat protein
MKFKIITLLSLVSLSYNLFGMETQSQEVLKKFTNALNGNAEVAKQIILDNQCIVEIQDNRGFTALIGSVHGRNDSILELLLDRRANPNIPNTHGTTALMYASLFVFENKIKSLLEAKANPRAQNKDGRTAIDMASARRNNPKKNLVIDELQKAEKLQMTTQDDI